MRILNISNVVGSKGGGISEVVQALTQYENIIGVHAELWFPGNSKLKTEVLELVNVENHKLKYLPTLGDPKFGLMPTLWLNFKQILDNFDIIHQHGIWLPYSSFTVALSKYKKTIISPHGLLEPERLQFSSTKKKIVSFLYEKANLAKCSCMVACSDQEAQGFRKIGIKQPIVIIPNGVDGEWLNKPKNFKSEFRERNNIKKDQHVLLFLSRIHPMKGLELFIRSLNIIKDQFRQKNWLFIIAGGDELGHIAELQELINKLQLSDIIRIMPPQYGVNKLEAFDASDMFVLPSINENFGIVVIEALARCIPVITTRRTPWQEIEEYKCGYWVERTEDAFVKTIQEILDADPAELSRLGENGRKLVAEKYIWSSIAEQTIAMYNWVLSDFDEKKKFGFQLFEG